MKNVGKPKFSDRGFGNFRAVRCDYGSTVEVYESSIDPLGSHLWLKVQVDPAVLNKQPYGEGVAHLSMPQMRRLRDTINAALRLAAWRRKPVRRKAR